MIPDISKPTRQFVNVIDELRLLVAYADEVRSVQADEPELRARVAALHAQVRTAEATLTNVKVDVEGQKSSLSSAKARHTHDMEELDADFTAQREALLEIKKLCAEEAARAEAAKNTKKKELDALVAAEKAHLLAAMQERDAVVAHIARLKAEFIKSIEGAK